uniref:Ubiquitin-like-conjugating enzyme ATG10 n=1 Tax=Nothobranchius furzeri TaxID=105023 RepID=A0A8C6LM83_NOTFU
MALWITYEMTFYYVILLRLFTNARLLLRCAAMTETDCCVLDEEDFRRCCRLLLQRSEQLRDGWSWEVVQGSDEGYLRKTALRSVPDPQTSTCSSRPKQSKEEPDCASSLVPDSGRGELDEEDDGSCIVSEGSSVVLQYEYHILYSSSYSTPVLYFRAFTLEGRSLTLEEVWSFVHPNFRLCLQNSPLNALSQQEHPLLGQPFFYLHPCRTEEFMKLVLTAAEDKHRPMNYVLLWLSLVGPAVGLDVPLEYCIEPQPSDPE